MRTSMSKNIYDNMSETMIQNMGDYTMMTIITTCPTCGNDFCHETYVAGVYYDSDVEICPVCATDTVQDVMTSMILTI